MEGLWVTIHAREQMRQRCIPPAKVAEALHNYDSFVAFSEDGKTFLHLWRENLRLTLARGSPQYDDQWTLVTAAWRTRDYAIAIPFHPLIREVATWPDTHDSNTAFA